MLLSDEERSFVWRVLGVSLLMATHCWPKVTTDSMTNKSEKKNFFMMMKCFD